MNGLTASRWFDFGDRPVLMQDGARRFRTEAGVVQWQNGSFPSCIRGYDSFTRSTPSPPLIVPTCRFRVRRVRKVEQRLGLRTRAVVLNLFEVCE